MTKIFENSWKLLLNAATESFVLNVTFVVSIVNFERILYSASLLNSHK